MPIKAGFSGPSVADGRVFASDWEPTDGMRMTVSLTATTGLPRPDA